MRWRISADKPFLTLAATDTTVTYDDFMRQVASLASELSDLGMQPGQTIATHFPTGIPALIAWQAVSAIGCVEMPIHPDLSGEPLQHILATCPPAAIIGEWSLHRNIAAVTVDPAPLMLFHGRPPNTPFPAAARDIEPVLQRAAKRLPEGKVSPSAAATVLFTSGTSGPAKGALLPHKQLHMVAQQVLEATGLNADDTYYCVHPLNHVAGKYMGVFAAMMAGAHVVLEERFDAAVWIERVHRHRITISMAHGPMLEMIHAQPASPLDAQHQMRRMMCCPLPLAIGAEFESRFDLAGIEMWGMTEIGNPLWTSVQAPRVPGSCGRLLAQWYDMQIADPQTDIPLPAGTVGEIQVRPRHPYTTMIEYTGRPDATAAAWRNQWFHTGDLAYQNASGDVFYLDRIGDRIRRRSENISSYEIEAAAMRSGMIAEAAAVGVPSGFQHDDEIKLFVVAGPHQEVDCTLLLTFLAGQLPHFMLPRYIETLSGLPRTPNKKVRKKELRDRPNGTGTWDRKAAGLRLRDLYRLP
ncbi:AMP-binding protein [Pelagibacterium halotolerans]|nr:AMP-binding protein [Pelagibacterium halotolerans]QJR17613.1 AMP-binding protein [Pelagibacterium halotolerans]